MILKTSFFALPFAFLYSVAVFADVIALSDDDMSAVVAQVGLSIQISTQANSVYMTDGPSGATVGAIAVEGISLLERNASTGVIGSTASSMTTAIDVGNNGGADTALTISTTFATNAALKVDSIKIVNSSLVAGPAINLSAQPSLGTLAITDLTGTAVIKVRSH